MIALLCGRLVSKTPDSAIVDVGGVGYEVFIPLSTYYGLPKENGRVSFHTITIIRDDTIELYGFLTPEEKRLFRLLISVTGVGPRLAKNILSGVSIEKLIESIRGEDVTALKRLPGVGKKTAQRVIVELKDKLKEGAERKEERVEQGLKEDVVSALRNLGYRLREAEEAVEEATKSAGKDFKSLLKEALKRLSE